MPRHDRAHGTWHSSRANGTRRVHKGRGHGRRLAAGRNDGNTPKPNAPTPQKPKGKGGGSR
jgi:hypothetical protein